MKNLENFDLFKNNPKEDEKKSKEVSSTPKTPKVEQIDMALDDQRPMQDPQGKEIILQ